MRLFCFDKCSCSNLLLVIAFVLFCAGCDGGSGKQPGSETVDGEVSQTSALDDAGTPALATSPPAKKPARAAKEPVTTYGKVDRIIGRELYGEVSSLPTHHPYYQAELGRVVRLLREVDGVFEADHSGRAIEVALDDDPQYPHIWRIGSAHPMPASAARQLLNPPADLDKRNAKLLEQLLEIKNEQGHSISTDLVRP